MKTFTSLLFFILIFTNITGLSILGYFPESPYFFFHLFFICVLLFFSLYFMYTLFFEKLSAYWIGFILFLCMLLYSSTLLFFTPILSPFLFFLIALQGAGIFLSSFFVTSLHPSLETYHNSYPPSDHQLPRMPTSIPSIDATLATLTAKGDRRTSYSTPPSSKKPQKKKTRQKKRRFKSG